MTGLVDGSRGEVVGETLNGRTVLVAGGTGNVGTVAVSHLLAAGATVVVPSRSSEKIERLRALNDDAGERLVTFVGDLGDASEAAGVRDEAIARAGPLDAAIATLGGLVAAPSILDASVSDLQRALDGYVLAHFVVARTLIPALEERGGSYVSINGALAFEPMFPGTGMVSVATAAQAMLARVVFQEWADRRVRVNELVLYTRFGADAGERRDPAPEAESSPAKPSAEGSPSRLGAVSQDEVGRFLAYLVSDGAPVRGESIHLDTRERLELSGMAR